MTTAVPDTDTSGRADHQGIRISVLSGGRALDFLDCHWPTLYTRDPHSTPYQSRAWLGGWAQHLPLTVTPVMVVAHDSSGPVAAIAMTQEVTDDGHDRMPPLSAPAAECIRAVGPGSERLAVANALVRCLVGLARDGTQVELSDVPADSALAHQLAVQWNGSLDQTPYATIALPVGYAGLSRTTQRGHRRRQRVWDNLAEHGHRVRYRRTQSVTELLETLPTLEYLLRLRRPNQPEGLLHPGLQPWRTVLERCSTAAFIATLTVDEDVVAAQLCLRRGTRVHSVLPAMNPAALALAPGHALLRHLTADLERSGYRTLDLGRTRPESGQIHYKAQYAATWTQTVAIHSHQRLRPDSPCTAPPR
ncbi:GNAT family N-acetyltransferase [Streptomyces sp. TLI_146]|uniref:GNAT family N-acetyltransferase n=1 Tax=Streptomyces sp. TLI_146 TaxID=1938858 RepID=UPI000CC9EE0A|nr:GNAT family N-acetyltransferase [Streptomyces sp. TLI_146]PKV82633.1 CelD/BcsL family acetyltransferase involved in cellulose biosynthesis [Streptomyces sp. TLI_146]